MNYALVKNGKVENIIIADADFVAAIAADWDHIEPIDTPGEQEMPIGMGWTYVNGVFAPPDAQ